MNLIENLLSASDEQCFQSLTDRLKSLEELHGITRAQSRYVINVASWIATNGPWEGSEELQRLIVALTAELMEWKWELECCRERQLEREREEIG